MSCGIVARVGFASRVWPEVRGDMEEREESRPSLSLQVRCEGQAEVGTGDTRLTAKPTRPAGDLSQHRDAHVL